MCRMLGRSDQRHAAQAMILRFAPRDGCGRRDAAGAARLADQERSIAHVVLVFWGARDDTLPPNRPMLARFPSRLRELPEIRHSGHQDAAEVLAPEIVRWVEGVAERPGAPRAHAP
jgi:pimeloyl-ACP methyl ester carboxylesterase